MTFDPLIVLAVGLIFAGITFVLARAAAGRQAAELRGTLAGEVATAQAQAQEAQRQLATVQRELQDRQARLAELQAELAARARDHHWLTGEVDRHKEAAAAAKQLLETAEQKLRDAFQSLAAQALHDNRAAFLDLAKSSFEGYQQPIAETLRHVDTRLQEHERERLAAYTRLMEQLAALGARTDTLVRALRTPAVRGRWGEMQLRRVVEIAGMLERCDFDEQAHVLTDIGRIRPDLIVHLPGRKRIVVDAKVPLEAFLEAQETTDDDERAAKLLAHARQVREHMDRLGSKAYWEQLGNSPELVVMFLPGETLFSAALQQDLMLIEYGLQQKVLLASPITLIALLTTVAHTWRQEALAENYREVSQLGKEFYERLARFTDYFDDVRKKLDGAVQAYNMAAGSFESRVLVSARRLRDLDVTTAPELPPADPIDTAPRVLKQLGLMGLPDEATEDDS